MNWVIIVAAICAVSAKVNYDTAEFLIKDNNISVVVNGEVSTIVVSGISELDKDFKPIPEQALTHHEDLSLKELFASVYYMDYQEIPVSVLQAVMPLQNYTAQLNLHIMVFNEKGFIKLSDQETLVHRGTILIFYFIDDWSFCIGEHDCGGKVGAYMDMAIAITKENSVMKDSSPPEITFSDSSTMLVSDYFAHQGELIVRNVDDSWVNITLRSAQFDRLLSEDIVVKSNATNQSGGSDPYEPEVEGGWTTVIVLSVVGGILLTGVITQIIVEYYCPKRAIDQKNIDEKAVEFSEV